MIRHKAQAASLLALLALGACKSSGNGDVKDLVVKQGDGKRRIYFTENGLVKTALCAANLPEDLQYSDPKTVREKCRESVSAGVKVADFRKALVKYFSEAYRTTELSSQEEADLNRIIREIEDPAAVTTGTESRPQQSDPYEMRSVWMQFLPFAAGALPSPTPSTRAPVSGTVFKSVDVTLSDDGAEFEVEAHEWPEEINLLTILASSSDQSGLCPAQINVLSVAQLDSEGKLAPIFGGEVIGGKRFLTNQPTKKMAGMRYFVAPDPESPRYRAGFKCTLSFTAAKVEPIDLNYKVYIPDPVKLDERDKKMGEMMATPEVRAWHFLWHGIRNSWEYMSPEEKAEVRKNLGVEWDHEKGGTGDPKQRGEEFLHMHHKMFEALKEHLGDQMYDSWTQPPAPDDAKYPMPGYVDPNTRNYYNSVSRQLANYHRQATDAGRLKNMSLSQFGLWLEDGMHNLMHNTWAHPTQWYTSYGPELQQVISSPDQYPMFSHPSNNSLVGTYTSHTNPIFYRLHGYIEARVQSWLDANGYKTIADKCEPQDKTCYQWKRTWDGNLPGRISAYLKAHQHGIDTKKIGTLPTPVFREISKGSQMVPKDR